MRAYATRLRRVRNRWVLRVTAPDGEKLAEYAFSSQAQARYYAAVIALGPRTLPAPPLRKPKRAGAPTPRTGPALAGALSQVTG